MMVLNVGIPLGIHYIAQTNCFNCARVIAASMSFIPSMRFGSLRIPSVDILFVRTNAWTLRK